MRSSAELFPWFRLVGPGMAINTDGALMAGFEYRGSDVESSSPEDLAATIRALEISQQGFDDRFVLWTFLDKRRHQYTGDSTIANPVARWADQRWRETVDNGNLRTVRHVMFLTFQPFGGSHGFLDEMTMRMAEKEEGIVKAAAAVLSERLSRKHALERMESVLESAIVSFEEALRVFVDTASTQLRLDRFVGDSLLAELSNRANLASPRQTVSRPEDGRYFLNTLLPTDTILREAGGVLRFEGAAGTKLVQMHAIKSTPGVADNGVIEGLLGCAADFTLAQMFRFLDREKAKALAQEAESHYRSNVKSPIVQMVEKATGVSSDKVNTGNLVLANDAQEALVEMTVDNVNQGYHSMVLQVIGDHLDEIKEGNRVLSSVLSNAGYGLVKEVVNAFGAFATAVPGAADAVTRTSLISTRNLSDLTVARTLSAGPDENAYLTEVRGVRSEPLMIMPTTTDVPENFNLHVGDVGHFLIVGPAGAGKSTLVNMLLIAWQRYAPCKVVALDKDLSNFITIKAIGGSYLDLRPDTSSKPRMNPARWLKRREDWPKLRSWLEIAIHAFDKSPLTTDEVRQLDQAILLAAEQTANHPAGGQVGLIHDLLRGQNPGLANRLAPFTRHQERYGEMFDNVEDDFSFSDVTGIELGGLLKDEHLAPAVLTYLFGTIEEVVDGTTPVLIYLEEAWYLLGDPVFRAMFEDWIRTMRKKVAAVGLATQSTTDIKRVPISSVLNDNIRTRFFLPNMYALDQLDVYQGTFGLTRADVEVIRTAKRKRQFLLVQDERKRLIDMYLPPDILALTRSDGKAKEVFRRAELSGDPYWLDNYIKEVTHVHA